MAQGRRNVLKIVEFFDPPNLNIGGGHSLRGPRFLRPAMAGVTL